MQVRRIRAAATAGFLLAATAAAAPAALAANLAPSFTRGFHQSVREDAGPQAVPGWATAITPGAGEEGAQAVWFEATNDHASLFAAPPAVAPDGTLTFTPAADASGTAVVTLVLHDDGGTADGGADASPPQLFSVTVVPVNDPPSFAAGADLAARPDAGPQTVPGWATAISPGPADEAAQTLAFAVETDLPSLFAAPPALAADGTLTFSPQPGSGGVARVTAVLADDGGTANGGADESAPREFTITVGEERPYAVALAAPAAAACPAAVTFDGTGSYHGAPGRSIVSYAWDLHHEGGFTGEAAGPTAATVYGELGAFTAALQVTDDATPAATGLATVPIAVGNRPPVAAAGGPYAVAIGRPLALSAAGSTDPDEGCGDRIASYAWDLDGDGDHDDAAGPSPTVGWEQVKALLCGGACAPGSSHAVSLRVTDAAGLGATAAAEVTITDAAALLTLTWPNGGELLGTGVPQAIRWVADPTLQRVSVSISTDGKSWKPIRAQVKAAPGTTTWTPPPADFRTTGRSWRFRLHGYRDGKKVASDLSDGLVGIGPLDLRVAEKGAELAGGAAVDVAWTTHRTAAKVAFTRFRTSCDGGATWTSLKLPKNPGTVLWTAPSPANRLDGCLARVDLFDASGARIGRDTGEGAFTILGGVDLEAPEGGDAVYGGTVRTVRWTTRATAAVAATRLRLSRDAGATWDEVAMLDGNPGRWRWAVPDVAEADPGCRFGVELLDAGGGVIAADVGEGDFTILLKGEAAAEPPVSITVPASSDSPGFTVSWGASPTPGATYELEEATDGSFGAGLRLAYAGGLLAAAIEGRANGATYHYRVRALAPGMNPSPWVPGGTGCAVAWVDPPVGPVTGFAAALAGSDARLSWVNPAEASFAGVRVLRRTDRTPQHAADGTVVYDGAAPEFTDPGLATGAYYYAAFAHDDAPSYAPPARAAALLGLPTRCEECHAGSTAHPQAPNVVNGPLPGTPGLFYNWSGSNSFRQDGGHGDPQGRDRPGQVPACGDCHDLGEPPPGDLHLNGVLESVFDDVARTANTAHLKGEFFTRFPALSPGDWGRQVAFDNYCAYACHLRIDTRVTERVPDMRHEVDSNGPNLTPDPVSVPGAVYTHVDDSVDHWSVAMGTHLTVANGDQLPFGRRYPMDQDLTTAATGPRYFAPCVACHDPHGTTLPRPASRDRNAMLRDEFPLNTLCLGCHQ